MEDEYGQNCPPVAGIVVRDPPEFRTQFGSGLHEPSALQVRFKFPPVFVYPAIQLKTMNDPGNRTDDSFCIC
jgi:hypothetical protein